MHKNIAHKLAREHFQIVGQIGQKSLLVGSQEGKQLHVTGGEVCNWEYQQQLVLPFPDQALLFRRDPNPRIRSLWSEVKRQRHPKGTL